jgi:hypothetical protein
VTDLLGRADSLLAAARHRLAVVLTGNSGTWPDARGELRLALVELDAARARLTRLADELVEADEIDVDAAGDLARLVEFLQQELRCGRRHTGATLERVRASISLTGARLRRAIAEGKRRSIIVRIPLDRGVFLFPLRRVTARTEGSMTSRSNSAGPRRGHDEDASTGTR